MHQNFGEKIISCSVYSSDGHAAEHSRDFSRNSVGCFLCEQLKDQQGNLVCDKMNIKSLSAECLISQHRTETVSDTFLKKSFKISVEIWSRWQLRSVRTFPSDLPELSW